MSILPFTGAEQQTSMDCVGVQQGVAVMLPNGLCAVSELVLKSPRTHDFKATISNMDLSSYVWLSLSNRGIAFDLVRNMQMWAI